MNWKLILQLSLFGLAMGIATVYAVPSSIEPLCWLAIFLICSWVIAARGVGRPFLHGLMIGIVNSVWVTGAHVLLYSRYIASHAAEVEMMKSMPMSDRPRLLMTLTGPVVGVISGVVLGLFAVVATKLIRPRAMAAAG